MENRGNFIILGVFVVGLFLAIIGSIGWLMNYSDDNTYTYYQINTKDSVSGLDIQAPVKYRGVTVGKVQKVFINPENSEEVSIVVKIKASTPIKEDTYALIEPQGITGLSYLEFKGGTNKSPKLKTSEEKLGVIKAKSSIFTEVGTTIRAIGEKTDEVLTSTNEVLKKADKVLNEKNIKNIEVILENIARVSKLVGSIAKSVDDQKKNINKIIENAKKLEESMIQASKKVGKMSDKITSSVEDYGISAMQTVRDSADSVKKLMANLQKKVDAGLLDFDNIAKDITQPAGEALNQLKILLVQTNELVEQLKKSPSDIFYKYSTQQPGPGERERRR